MVVQPEHPRGGLGFFQAGLVIPIGGRLAVG